MQTGSFDGVMQCVSRRGLTHFFNPIRVRLSESGEEAGIGFSCTECRIGYFLYRIGDCARRKKGGMMKKGWRLPVPPPEWRITMEHQVWADSVLKKMLEKYPSVTERNRGRIPYTAENGRFNDCSGEGVCWWTNGFYAGILWQLYHVTGEAAYRQEAEAQETKLDAVLMNYGGMDHDSGFRFLLSAVADYRLTGNPASKNRGLLAAANLAGRFNPQGNFIRAWNDETGANAGWAIIDCMMNLPLLYWASEITGDPRFYHIAVRHADTAMRHFIRENGSVRHIVEFDAGTGCFVQDFGGQGYEKGSSWTRGQAWALYGFALSYLYTGETRYLDTAGRVAAYFISNIPESGLIPVDFCQPESVTLEDSSAAAIAASGLLLLSEILYGQPEVAGGRANLLKRAMDGEAEKLETAAVKLLKALEKSRCSFGADRDELLERCTAAYHDENHEFPIIYGDYFFLEAILRLAGKESFLW